MRCFAPEKHLSDSAISPPEALTERNDRSLALLEAVKEAKKDQIPQNTSKVKPI
jgi:hypothetical protein